jgi:hypothetical protein
MPLPQAIEVFFSYAHKDEGLRNQLANHLSGLELQGVITGWYDRDIGAGKEWDGEIDTHLNTARIILLLISSDFMASRYCRDVEVTRAMERHKTGEAVVIPVILRPVLWENAPFSTLQALPKDAKPVTNWLNRDEAFKNIAQGIETEVNKLIKASSYKNLRSDQSSSVSNDPLENLLIRFLRIYSHGSWYFNAQRIYKWGLEQEGFKDLKNCSSDKIDVKLQQLHSLGLLKTKLSKQGNTLYAIKQ